MMNDSSDEFDWKSKSKRGIYYSYITDLLAQVVPNLYAGRYVDDVWCDGFFDCSPLCYSYMGIGVRPISDIEKLKYLTKIYYFFNRSFDEKKSFYLYCDHMHQSCMTIDEFKLDCDAIVLDGEINFNIDGGFYVVHDDVLISNALTKMLKKCELNHPYTRLIADYVKNVAIFSEYATKSMFTDDQWLSGVVLCARNEKIGVTIRGVMGSIL